MREIKFRVWDFKKKKFFFYDGIFNNSREHEKRSVFNFPKPHKLQIQQFTGLKDKKGKEIYEGDIVKDSLFGGIYEVFWHDAYCEFSIAIKNEKVVTHWYDSFYWKTALDLEVVGNIFENPIDK